MRKTGQPKTWYGVPHRSAKKFEKVMKDHLMEAFKMNPDLLHHITTMFSPSLLVENGVDVVRILQARATSFRCSLNPLRSLSQRTS